ncbi:MAG: hypothetical protein ACOC4M_07360 [Promethearchaeia archaeon]
MQKTTPEAREVNLCEKCPTDIRGKCCYLMTEINGYLLTLTNHPCKYLNLKTNRCKIYLNRRKNNKNCLSIKEMKKVRALPKECLYVKNDTEYQKEEKARRLTLPKNPSRDLMRQYKKENSKAMKKLYNRRYKEAWCFYCPECESIDIEGRFDNENQLWWYICHQCEIFFARIRDQIKLNRLHDHHQNGDLLKLLKKLEENPSFKEVSD